MKSVKLENVYVIDEDFLSRTQARSWMETPEQRLLFAILERAVRDFLGNRQQDLISARDWLFELGDDLQKSPFSFDWVCEELGIDVGQFRSRLMRAEASVRHRAGGYNSFSPFLQEPEAGGIALVSAA
jgi:hypothetical protein